MLSLFLFFNILSNPPQEAWVAARIAAIKNQPKSEALSILQLKEGDRLEILEVGPEFVKVRYRLEGDFPIEGWIAKDALNIANAKAPENKSPQYEAAAKAATTTEIKEFPTAAPGESLQPQAKASRPTNAAGSKTRLEDEVVHKPGEGPWKYNFDIETGTSSVEESIRTRIVDQSDQAYASEPFLKYDVQGLKISAGGKVGYDFGPFEAGGFASYGLCFYRGDVSAVTTTNNPGINTGNVQATDHDIKIGAYIQRDWRPAKSWGIRPEVLFFPNIRLFLTNQLKSTDNVNPGVEGQSVLFSTNTYALAAALKIHVFMPFDLEFVPSISTNLFSVFTESPTVESSTAGTALADADKIRTGNPSNGSMQVSYGLSLRWNLKSFHWETVNLLASYQVQDLSKKYSGLGNRAGLKMKDAKTSTQGVDWLFGVQYLF